MSDSGLPVVGKVLDGLAPVSRPTSPGAAALLGLALGGLGLAIYFRTLVDLVVPVLLTFAVMLFTDGLSLLGWIIGALVASAWGLLRSANSNERLQRVAAAAPVGV